LEILELVNEELGRKYLIWPINSDVAINALDITDTISIVYYKDNTLKIKNFDTGQYLCICHLESPDNGLETLLNKVRTIIKEDQLRVYNMER